MGATVLSQDAIAVPGEMANEVSSRTTLDDLAKSQAEGWFGTDVANATPGEYQQNSELVAANIASAGDSRAPTRPSLRRIAMFLHNTNTIMQPRNLGAHIVIGRQIGVQGRQLPYQPSASTARKLPAPWGKSVVIGGGGNNG